MSERAWGSVAAVEAIRRYALSNAIGARARGSEEEERRWLDLLINLDNLANLLAAPAGNEAAADGLRQVLYDARDALYRGEGPDTFADSDLIYGEWLGNRADALHAPSDAQVAAMREVADTAARALLDP